jgi:hypothetical protein
LSVGPPNELNLYDFPVAVLCPAKTGSVLTVPTVLRFYIYFLPPSMWNTINICVYHKKIKYKKEWLCISMTEMN